MLNVRGRVRGGRLLVDEPTDLPEGSEVELVAADDVEADLEAWSPELDAELARRYAAARDGEVVSAEDFLEKLRARRAP